MAESTSLWILAAGVLLALLFWPRYGAFDVLRARRKARRRALYEDVLKHMLAWERRGKTATPESVTGALGLGPKRVLELITRMETRGLLRSGAEGLSLTPEGERLALHVVRAPRLWERYLADHTGLAESEWHRRADKVEHSMTPSEADQLSARLGNPAVDPHGDPVPRGAGELLALEGKPLKDLENGEHARIVHVEDEPQSVYSELVHQGLHPGVEFRLVEKAGDRFRVRSEGSEREISALAAANLTVRPTTGEIEGQFRDSFPLSTLKTGESGRVLAVSRASRGPERRRFMDLGILPGTLVTAELAAPGGDPVAYRIRGALIALRKEQARKVLVVADDGKKAA